MTTIHQHQANLMQMINDCPDLLIRFFDTTIDTLQNIDYVFNKYQVSDLVDNLYKYPGAYRVQVENQLPVYIREGLCENIKINLRDIVGIGHYFHAMNIHSDFNRYLRFRLFEDMAYPIRVPIMDFPPKIREDIENNYFINKALPREILSTDTILAMQQYSWHTQFAQHNGYELAMYDPRSPYGRARLKLAKDCVSELIKIREFLKDYMKQSKFETPLSETVVFNTQQTEAQPWTKSTSRTHQA